MDCFLHTILPAWVAVNALFISVAVISAVVRGDYE
jgi:hypothetical protein